MHSLHPIKKGYRQLLSEYMEQASKYGLIDPTTAGDNEHIDNVIIMEFAIHSQILEKIYQDMEKIQNSLNIDKATGEELDTILEPFLPRNPATHAHTIIKLTWEETLTKNIILGSEFEVHPSKDKNLTFRPSQEYTLKTNETSKEIEVICTIPGNEGNLPKDSIDTGSKLIGIPSMEVKQPYPALGGRAKEDDDSYRLRSKSWKTIMTHGTYDALKNAVVSVPEVKNYYIQRYADGLGTTKIIVDPAEEEVILKVQRVVNNVCAVDEKYIVEGVKPTEIDISLNMLLDSPNNLNPSQKSIKEVMEQVKELIKSYVEGSLDDNKGLKLGEDLVPSRLSAYLLNNIPLLKDVTISKPATILKADPTQKLEVRNIDVSVL